MRVFLLCATLVLSSPVSVAAQTELSFYGGSQGAFSSEVSGDDPSGVGPFRFISGWEGRSFEAPPYYGVRLTWWRGGNVGWGVELNHAKIHADNATLADNGLNTLEFSDGLNLLTVNTYRRWQNFSGSLSPYIGAGLGVAVPHVEFDSGGGATSGYQMTGPAVQVLAGASYPISERWSVFGEYKGSISANSADLLGGGDLNTTVVTSAVNVGLSLGF